MANWRNGGEWHSNKWHLYYFWVNTRDDIFNSDTHDDYSWFDSWGYPFRHYDFVIQIIWLGERPDEGNK